MDLYAGSARRGRPATNARDRILREGPRAVSDLDLFTVVLSGGSCGRRSSDIAARLLADGGAPLLAHATPERLLSTPAVGRTHAFRTLAALELGRRVWCRRGTDERPIRGPEEIQDRFRSYSGARKEHFLALHLNTRHVVVREELVSIGSLNASIVHPREVFRTAILEAAASLILVHNHPSGDPTPSEDDIRITTRLTEVGELVGIPIVDHVVLGDGTYYSFRAAKMIR